MGWGYAVLPDGRAVGYSVEATCEAPGCETRIDRGLAYRCGNIHTDVGCGHHFCADHLGFAKVDGVPMSLCDTCYRDDEDDC